MKFKELIWNIFAPGLHITFAVMWFLGLEGSLVFLKGGDRVWELDSRSVINIISILLVLFYLRVVDEMKDYEYDKIYNPSRPLVCGIVTFSELWTYLAVVTMLVILINLPFSYNLVFILVLDMIYALFLMWLENISATVRDNMLLNLLVTYPVNITLSIYIYMSFLERYNAAPDFSYILMICAVAFAFLNYEFGRKISMSKQMSKGQRLYSNEIGLNGAILLWVIFGLIACSILLGVFQPWRMEGIIEVTGWFTILMMIPVYLGLYRFLKERHHLVYKGKETRLTGYALEFLVMFYIILIINVLIDNKVIFNIFYQF